MNSPNVKKCIVAVDDAPDMLKAVFHALHDQYKVVPVQKPETLKEVLKTIKPDLFLLDYNMPVLSGFHLIPVIRSFPEHKDTPIIFLTSDGTVDNISDAVARGAKDYILKPFNPGRLREKIAQHI